MDVSNFISITIAVVAMGAFAVQRYRDRRAEMGIVQELQKIKTALEKGQRGPSPEHVESLISGVVERKRNEVDQKEFDAMRDLAVESYSKLRELQQTFRNLLEEKATFQSRIEARDNEIAQLKRTAFETVKRLENSKQSELERLHTDHAVQVERMNKDHAKEVEHLKTAMDKAETSYIRKINRLTADVQALEHTISRLSGVEDSGPMDPEK